MYTLSLQNLEEIEATVDNAQVVSKSGNKDDKKFMRGTGQPTTSSKSEIIAKVQKSGRKSVSSRINWPNEPIWLVVITGGSRI